MINHNSLIDILQLMAKSEPYQVGYTFLDDGEENELNITYRELDIEAQKIAGYLQSQYEKGDRAILFYPPGLDFIKAFFGCLYSGIIAVPSYPPKMNRGFERINAILSDATPSIVLTTSEVGYDKVVTKHLSKKIPVINTDKIEIGYKKYYENKYINQDDIAFLQYTSGSTGTPKGVIVTHKNILSNENLIQRVFKISKESIILGWLPFYHDMGLIGNIIQPVYSGCRCILMSPIHFLEKQSRWLNAISKYSATVSGGPNFAYDLCCEKVSENDIEGINLATWKVAFNGAEPVRPDTLKNFYKKFAKYGFSEKAFLPCYGMSETTLFVSGIETDKEPVTFEFCSKDLQYEQSEFNKQLNKGKIELVSCGGWEGFNLALVNESGFEVGSGVVGEIWLQGDSIANGYWNNKKETEFTFRAQINGKTGKFLRTGDLGIVNNGELYIAGRIKDLIILNGRNYYPQDIEFSVGKSNIHVIKESVAAFSISVDTKEQLIIVAEIAFLSKINIASIVQDIRQKIVDEYEIVPYSINLIRKGTLLKTTSGKVQRKDCKESYLNNSLIFIDPLLSKVNTEKPDISSFNKKEQEIYNIIKDELANYILGKDTDLFNIGLDSIKLTQITYRLGEYFNKEISVDFIIENPTINKIARNISFLKEFKSINHHIEGESFPASKLQELIWVNQQRDPESTGYNLPVLIGFDEEVAIDKLNESIRSLINKYAILRTNFQIEENSIYQKINPRLEIDIKLVDLSCFQDSELEKQISLCVKNESIKVFNLEKDILIRLTLIRKSTKRHCLLIVFHHIIIDGSSIVILLNELKENYRRLLKGEKIRGSSPEYDFVDFVLYEKAQMSDYVPGKKKEFWLREFSREFKRLDLPYDYSILDSKSREGSSFFFNIEHDLFNRINKAVKHTKINQFSYLLTAYYLLLHRLSGSYNLVVGIPVSLRQRREFENIIGLLINTVMFRMILNGEETLQKLLQRVYDHSGQILRNADYPFSQILRDTKIPIAEDQLAISSVYFNYLDFINSDNSNQLFDFYKSSQGIDLNFDLNLYVLPNNEFIRFRLDYRKNNFKESSAEKIAQLYTQLIVEIIESPGTVLKKLRAYFEETVNVIKPYNDFQPFLESDIRKPITVKFQDIVDKFSTRVAIKTNAETYTYSDINKQSDVIAIQIELNEIKKPSAIGLLFGHEINMIFSILGVLKTGNYYVPLDIDYPFERLAYILNDADIKVIITNGLNLTKAKLLAEKSDNNIKIINLDKRKNSFAKLTHKVRNSADSLAYILYTSGSTGVPKGVMQTHEYVLHLVYSFTNSLHISKEDCFTLIPSFNFSASVMDLFGVILNGASLYLVDIKKDGIKGLVEGMENNDITVYHSVPTLFRAVVEFLESCDRQIISLKKIRLIYLAGEPLLRSDVCLYKENFHNNCLLVNGLGCTEFNICRQFFIDKHTEISTSTVPIGYKAIGVEVIIVDENRIETINNEPGEIAIRSKYLSIGYYNSPDLTEKKFKTIDSKKKDRIYYTGDIGRKLVDGCLMYMGRKDFQVKLRGQRIELAEIETAMLKIDGISRAIVSLKEDKNLKFLCAYYIQNKDIDIDSLKKELARTLPGYMVPSYFMQLPSFPLTDSGKLDRRNLPIPENHIQNAHCCELTDKETQLSKIWADILNLDYVKLIKKSNFFEIGGNSLHAIQLIQKIHKEFDKKVELKEIFSNQTLEQQASLVEKTCFPEKFNKILKVPDQDTYELSHSQKRLWILSQLSNASIAYHITAAFELVGVYDNELFQKVFEGLIDRHESLRTAIVEIEGEPRQKILSFQDTCFKIENIDLINNINSKEKISQFLNNKANIPFKLSNAPLFRVTVMRTECNKHIMLLSFHHIICDGWSMNVIMKDILVMYNAFRKRIKIPLKPLSFQYKDYSNWLNQQYSDLSLEKHKDYWKKKFDGEIPVLNFPTDNPRPKVQTYNGNLISFEINTFLTDKIRLLCQKENVTLFMALLGFVKTLLYRYSGQNDIIVGVPVAGRYHPDMQDQVGLYINTLAIRTSFDMNIGFRELLTKIKETTLEAFEHQMYSFDRLIDELNVARDLSRSPLFDIMVVLQNKDVISTNLPQIHNLKIKRFETLHTVSKFDITFNFSEYDEIITCDIEYNTDLFAVTKINRFHFHLLNIIEKITSEPAININAFDFLTFDEQQNLLYEFNNTKADYPREKTIIDLFEEQVRRVPESIAVIFGEQKLTYYELNNKANQIGRLLRKKGLKKENIVAIMVERSLEMIIGIYGILKAGGAYLPIDPNYPENRKKYIIENSEVTIILTQEHFISAIQGGFEKINLDNKDIYQGSVDNLDLKKPNLAYVIYTSGSTGNPKGVMIKHDSLVNRLNWMQKFCSIGHEDTILHKTPFTFDVSVWEIFLWALSGSKVCLLEHGGEKEPYTILKAIEEHRVSILHFVPSMLGLFLDYIASQNIQVITLKSIKQVISSGEALLPLQVEKFNTTLRKANGCQLTNLYGPTEATIDVTYYDCPDNCGIAKIPIGKPIDNINLYIVDAYLNLLPIGVTGELCIRGIGLAKGYLNNEELTNEKFIQNPFGEGILYRTGDLARWLDDGNIEFMGRKDHQIKIRGNRVELGEIESVLTKHQMIKGAIVNVMAEKEDKYLCAYIIAELKIEDNELRDYLARTLPDYMIPSHFVRLEYMPLTLNGKIDRKALPNPEIRAEDNYIAPTNEMEEILVSIWSEILKLNKDQIGINISFFEIGGQSLNAITLANKIHRELNIEISILEIFQKRTIREICRLLQAKNWISTSQIKKNENKTNNKIVI